MNSQIIHHCMIHSIFGPNFADPLRSTNLLAWARSLLGGDTGKSIPLHQQSSAKNSESMKFGKKTEQPNWHVSLLKMLPDQDLVQTPWLDRWADIEP
jgi:hypothetical protein